MACDQFVGIPGKTVRAPQYMEYTFKPIEELRLSVLKKVGRDNAAKLLGL
ncbi:MAG: hypothetical protein ACYTFY_08190 [Planctomycetota bacterium]